MTTQGTADPQEGTAGERPAKTVKCVVWDLDHTLWDGILLEDGEAPLRPGLREVIVELDRRGILHSVASRNDHDAATAALRRHGLLDYFLYPQINWNAKSSSIRSIAASLNLGLEAFAFVDDDAFERGEVAFELPELLCVDAADAAGLADRPEFSPRFVTEDSARRREMYRADQERTRVEQEFTGPQEAFLATLGMTLTVLPAQEEDLRRAEELTVRTHQLNTTGYTYSYEELDAFRRSDTHELLVARLEDRHGPYGTIGLVLLAGDPGAWTVKLLLMSCRVMSRGVGGVIINLLRRRARAAGVRLLAEYLPNGRNRMMLITYKFTGFRQLTDDDGPALFEADLTDVPGDPQYLTVQAPSLQPPSLQPPSAEPPSGEDASGEGPQ
ncbi:HAD superfamily phosphatase (TIGR01681 family)/FkbH-like protein [Kitasatospora sp. SolWspMP-SS2h]|uniref:HAD-IIIC family phosphatase n=1 Tax=Kitasatospora sp. SolWspMP-SS2h TaxID=1305729 RepID=UPI000DB93CC1|nr:HAD-IIIC family phosphatase [Kitasatospora sp. SolWspMP-SS2h]RAJ38451.1 HAD superfamily phosphatase (TIGR01681 family)/FkbH-like protein [Kitasatospora sp. SolWspMP-SS2h]